MHPISVVEHAGFGNQGGRAFGVGDRWREDALEILAGVALERINVVAVKSPFLGFIHAVQKARVVDAMAHDAPVALADQGRNIREMV